MLKLSLVCSSLGMDAHPKTTEIWKAHLCHGILSLCDCLFTKTSRAPKNTKTTLCSLYYFSRVSKQVLCSSPTIKVLFIISALQPGAAEQSLHNTDVKSLNCSK